MEDENQRERGREEEEEVVEWVAVVAAAVAVEDGFNPGAGLSLTNCQ